MKKILATPFIALITGLTVFSFFQYQELKARDVALKVAKSELDMLRKEVNRFKVVNAINYGATAGLYGVKPEIIADANNVAEFILASTAPVEEKFKECWDRKLKTTNWGSNGPEGILDDCIDSIASADTAILMREIDNKANSTGYTCRSSANNRFEGARDCSADKNYRLIISANRTLFEFITTKDWIDNQKPMILE